LINRLKQLIRWASVGKGGDDNKQFPVQQAKYLGKVGDCFMIFPYGMHGNAVPETLIAMFAVGANAENRAGIPCTGQDRPQMAEGELCLYHPPSQSIIHFRASGDIDIDTVKNESGNININTTEANITGNVNITGDLTVTGDTALGTVVTSSGTNISGTHVHPGVTTGAGSTGTPV